MSVKNRRSAPVVALLCVSVIAGCTGVTNPYVKPQGRPEAPTLDQAIKYANDAKGNYQTALGNQGKLNTWLGIGLVPLGAATLGLAVTGASQTAVTVLGLTGAAAYGTATWLRSEPQQRAYIAGYNAINCAIEAVVPLRLDTKSPEYSRFIASMNVIDNKIADVETQIGAVERLIVQVEPTAGSGDRLVVRAKEEVTAARSIVDSAVTARQGGTSLALEIAGAGNNLTVAVDRIAGQVDEAILSNQPDIQALTSIIGGLGQAYSKFTVVPESSAERLGGAEVTAQAGPAGDLSRELGELQRRAADLSVGQRRVADFVNALVAKKPVESLKNCGVDLDQLTAQQLVIDPAGPVEFAEGQAGSVGLIIVGGRAPYAVQLVDEAATGLSVRQVEPFGPAFLVQATAEAVPGQYSIYVADAAGQRKYVSVVVKARPDTQPRPTASVADPIFDALAQPQRERIQRALCIPESDVDGAWGPQTRAALELYQRSVGRTADGVMSEQDRNELLAFDTDDIAQRCGGNQALTEALTLFADNLEEAGFDVRDGQFQVIDRPIVDTGQERVRVTYRVIRAASSGTVTPDEIKQQLIREAAISGELIKLDHIELEERQ